jgi:hypothetical protein
LRQVFLLKQAMAGKDISKQKSMIEAMTRGIRALDRELECLKAVKPSPIMQDPVVQEVFKQWPDSVIRSVD